MAISEIDWIAKLIGVAVEFAAKRFKGRPTPSMGLEFYVTDHEGETRGEHRLVEVDLREESVSKWLISGIEVLGPRRAFRRPRFPVAFRGQDPSAWTKRLTLRNAMPGCVFQLHDDAPDGLIVRVHARGRFNAGKKACRDEPYGLSAHKIDWGSAGRGQSAGHH